jgi:hypothetical protein
VQQLVLRPYRGKRRLLPELGGCALVIPSAEVTIELRVRRRIVWITRKAADYFAEQALVPLGMVVSGLFQLLQ